MKRKPNTLSLTIAAALGALVAWPAHAVLTTSSSASFSGSTSVTDTCGTVSTSACPSGPTVGSSLALTALPGQFSASLGVLTGTKIKLESTRTQTISGSVSGGSSTSTPKTATTGTGKSVTGSAATLTAPGANATLGALSNLSASATVNIGTTASFGPTAKLTTTNVVSPVSDPATLNSYVGGSTVPVNLNSAKAQADSTFSNGRTNITTSSSTYKVDWAGTVTAEYTYLLHAAPSFDGSSLDTLDLDFGTFFLGDSPTNLDFSIVNAAGERVGLDLRSLTGSGDTAKLSTSASLFNGLGAGSSSDFFAAFDTSELGIFSATYRFSLADENVGATSSQFAFDNALTLRLTGSVIEKQSVPEPSIVALLGLGLLGLGFGRRKRG